MADNGEAVKFDQDKLQIDLVPVETIEGIAAVLSFGASKYGRDNWRQGMIYSRLIAAALRHFYAWIKGESKDPESGLSHLYHLMCCITFLSEYERTDTGTDDRRKEKKNRRDWHESFENALRKELENEQV